MNETDHISAQQKEAQFTSIVSEHKRAVFYHILKMVHSHDDAEDLTQETFIKVWKNLDKFRGDSKLSTWIYRISTNVTLTHLSSQKRKAQIVTTEEYSEDAISSAHPDADLVDGSSIEDKLRKAILTLPEKQRLVFNMRYFDEMKYEEIADILDTSVGSLKASYHYAVKKIEDFVNSN